MINGKGTNYTGKDRNTELIIITVISTALYFTDNGEHTAPKKITESVYIKTSKMIIIYS